MVGERGDAVRADPAVALARLERAVAVSVVGVRREAVHDPGLLPMLGDPGHRGGGAHARRPLAADEAGPAPPRPASATKRLPEGAKSRWRGLRKPPSPTSSTVTAWAVETVHNRTTIARYDRHAHAAFLLLVDAPVRTVSKRRRASQAAIAQSSSGPRKEMFGWNGIVWSSTSRSSGQRSISPPSASRASSLPRLAPAQ